MKTYQSTSCKDTEKIGTEIAGRFSAGDVVFLEGELGAGKTAMVRGITSGLGSPDHVSSPTFVLIHEYNGKFPIVHLDLYRLSGEADLEDLGLSEYMDGRWVALIEWPERAEGYRWDAPIWRINLKVTSEDSREIAVTPPDGRTL